MPAGAQEYFNTVKAKLENGQQVVGGTISSPDVDIYCAMANAGFDFLWIEMQHSPLTYSEVAAMIRVGPGPAIPASSDLGSFTGLRQGDPDYEAIITRIKDATRGVAPIEGLED